MQFFEWRIMLYFSLIFLMYLVFSIFLNYSNVSDKHFKYTRSRIIEDVPNSLSNTSMKDGKSEHLSNQSRDIVILTYTSFFGDLPWPYFNPVEKCTFKTSNFHMTHDKAYFSRSDVVMFHSRNMPSTEHLESLASMRKNGQLWIYFTMESIHNNPGVENINKYFNATATYGVDTDISLPYRFHGKRLEINTSLNADYFLNKTRMVAWVVSNCGGYARNSLARKLITYGVDIEVSGSCSKNFPKSFSSSCKGRPCFTDLRNFKFYFSAENSLCDGYITEKYWDSGLNYNLIPIVLGGSNYSDPRLAVPGSFIDAMSFDSPKALADHILDVSSNSTKYNSFFEWKKSWQLDSDSYFCVLCDKIRNGFKLRTNALMQTMNVTKCSRPHEKFNIWINKS